MSELGAFVFDAYGTLFDVHAAIARHRTAAGPDADRFSELWRAKQLEYSWTLALAGRYVDFWTLTEQALDYAFARVPSVDPSLRSSLLESYLVLDAFPDARAALVGLRSRGLRTAILSNGAPHMLTRAIAASGLDGLLDAVLSVDTLRTYKPKPEVYALAANTLALPPGRIGFISSNRWDIMGAAAFGFKTFWINRTGAPDEYGNFPAARQVANLAALGLPEK